MKKIIATLITLLIFALCFTVCDLLNLNETESETETKIETETETESETKAELQLEDTDYNAACIKRKGKRLVLLLPESQEILPITNSYVKFMSNVSDEMVLEAEQKITEGVNAIGGELEWTFEINEAGELCLKVEVIKFIEDAEGEGCGIDHEHIVFSEPITAQE